jgi:hypothetical protein
MIKRGSKRVVLVLVVLAVLLALPFLIDLNNESISFEKSSLSHKELDVVVYGGSSFHIEIPEEIKEQISKKTDKIIFVVGEGSLVTGAAVADDYPVVKVKEGRSTEVDLDNDGVNDVVITTSRIYNDGTILALFKWLNAPEEIEESSEGLGLVAHWEFDNDASDSSGNGVDGDLKNGARIEDEALGLDGVDDFVEVLDNAALNSIKEEVSISAWIDLPTMEGTRAIFDGYKDHGNSNGFGLWTVINPNKKLFVSFAAFKGKDPQVRVKVEEPTQKIHLVGVYDGEKRHIFVNGELMGSNEVSGTFSDVGFSRKVGGQVKAYKSEGRFFEGKIHEIKIWNVALTESDVSKEFNSGAEPEEPSPKILKLNSVDDEIEKIFNSEDNVLEITDLPSGLGDHTITYLGFDKDSQKFLFRVESEPQIIAIAAEDSEDVDLNGDGIPDLSVTVGLVTGDDVPTTIKALPQKSVSAFPMSNVGDKIPVPFGENVDSLQITDLPFDLGDHVISYQGHDAESNNVQFSVSGKEYYVKVGETLEIDLNEDGVKDVSFTVHSFGNGNANTTIELLAQSKKQLALPEGVQNACFDSDEGFDPEVFGYLEVIKDGVIDDTVYEDSCVDGKLNEVLCQGSVPSTRLFPRVLPGYVCDGGKLQRATGDCEDEDGGDIYTKGVLKVGGFPGVTKGGEDYCNGNSRLAEQTCVDGKANTIYYSCLCEDGICTEEVEETYCRDPDPIEQILEKTKLEVVIKGVRQPHLEFEDSCAPDGKIREANCAGATPNIVLKDCGIGRHCVQGVCVDSNFCEDSDDGDVFSFGSVSYGASNNLRHKFDQCSGPDKLEEQICNDGKLAKLTVACDCIRGACVNEGQEVGDLSCTDSDDENTESKGFVEYTDFSGTLKMEDFCISPDVLNEFTCSKNGIGSSTRGCQCKDGACIGERIRCEEEFGFDIYQKKELTVQIGRDKQEGIYVDDCTPDGKVKEWFCGKHRPHFQEVACPDGETCSEGVCMEKLRGLSVSELSQRLQSQSQSKGSGHSGLPAWILTNQQLLGSSIGISLGSSVDSNILCDDDDGTDFGNKGAVVSKGQTYKDVCNADPLGRPLYTEYTANAVVEKICQSDELRILFKECDETCINGECVKQHKGECNDLDLPDSSSEWGRIPAELIGSKAVETSGEGAVKELKDKCVDGLLHEAVCIKGKAEYSELPCLEGTGCGIDACVPTSQPLREYEMPGDVPDIVYIKLPNGEIEEVKINKLTFTPHFEWEGNSYVVNRVGRESLDIEVMKAEDFSKLFSRQVERKDLDVKVVSLQGEFTFDEAVFSYVMYQSSKIDTTFALLSTEALLQCEGPTVTDIRKQESVKVSPSGDQLYPETYTDSCEGFNKVIKNTCSVGKRKVETVPCGKGLMCDGGACIPLSEASCVDEDSGDADDIFKQKFVRYPSSSGWVVEQDTCLSATLLREGDCSEANKFRMVNCGEGFACAGGACVELKVPECKDEDSGDPSDIFKQKFVRYPSSSGLVVEQDTCLSATLLREGDCGEANKFRVVNCGEGCGAGACLESIECSEDDEGNDPSLYSITVEKWNGKDQSKGTDTCVSNTGLREFYCDEENRLKSVSVECEEQDKCVAGACVPKNPLVCTDSDGKNKYVQGVANDKKEVCVQEGETLFSDDIEVDKCEGENCKVREHSCLLNVELTQNLPCDSGCQQGACIPELQAHQLKCVETDGGSLDFTAKGSASFEREKITDECVAPKRLKETYCEGDELKFTYIDCPLGCSDGACLNYNPSLGFCEDSDGGINIYVPAQAYQGNEVRKDYCRNDRTLIEATCDFSKGETSEKVITCPAGCLDGACVVDVDKDSCEETDGGTEVLISGTVRHSSGASISDSCATDQILREAICVSSNTGTSYLSSLHIDCRYGCSQEKCREEAPKKFEVLSVSVEPPKGTPNTRFVLKMEVVNKDPPRRVELTANSGKVFVTRGNLRRVNSRGDVEFYEAVIVPKRSFGAGFNSWEESYPGVHSVDLAVQFESAPSEATKSLATFEVVEAQGCFETDDRKDIFVAGNADANGESKNDVCYQKKDGFYSQQKKCTSDCYVEEAFCQGENVKAEKMPCPGNCVDGACVKEDKFCDENDDGSNTAKAGAFVHNLGEFNDYCKDDVLFYGQCDAALDLIVESQTCPNGCSEGRCLQKFQECSNDLDGPNIFVKGGVNGVSEGCIVSHEYGGALKESCIGANCNLHETWCDPDEGKRMEKITCDYGCYDGACVREDQTFCSDPDVHLRITDPRYAPHYGIFISKSKETATVVELKMGETVLSERADICFNTSHVTEAVCEANGISEVVEYCGDGYLCSRGKCLEASCDEADGGNVKHLQGELTKGHLKRNDTCLLDPVSQKTNRLKEYFCHNGKVQEQEYKCEFGCFKGACLSHESDCVDLDLSLGDSFEQSSALVLSSGFEIERKEDKCVNVLETNEEGQEMWVGHLDEAVCVDGKLSTKEITCPEGCDGDACKQAVPLVAASCFGMHPSDPGFRMEPGSCLDPDMDSVLEATEVRARSVLEGVASYALPDGCAVYDEDLAQELITDVQLPVVAGSCGGPLTYNKNLYRSPYRAQNSCFGDNCFVREAVCNQFGDIQGVNWTYQRCADGDSCLEGRCVPERIINSKDKFVVYPYLCEDEQTSEGLISNCDELVAHTKHCPGNTFLSEHTVSVTGGTEKYMTDKIKLHSTEVTGNSVKWIFEVKSSADYVPSLEVDLALECRNNEGVQCNVLNSPEGKKGAVLMRNGEVLSESISRCDANTVVNFSCNGNSIVSKEMECPQDSFCSVGICELKSQYCDETDDGEDYFTKGEISGENVLKTSDSCVQIDPETLRVLETVAECKGDHCRLQEYSCNGISFTSGLVTCELGCRNGACLLDTTRGILNYKTVTRTTRIDYAQSCDNCEKRISRTLRCPNGIPLDSSTEEIIENDGFGLPIKNKIGERMSWVYESEPTDALKLVSDQTIICKDKNIITFTENGVEHKVLSSQIDLLPYLGKEVDLVFQSIQKGVPNTVVHVENIVGGVKDGN